MTHTELLELAEYIKAWFDSPSGKKVLGQHGGQLFGNLHSTGHFTPWHRITVRMLEDFLLTQPNGHNYMPLPKWEPVFADGTPNPLPVYFNGKKPDGSDYAWFSEPCLTPDPAETFPVVHTPPANLNEPWFRSLTTESPNIPHNFLYLNNDICRPGSGGVPSLLFCNEASNDFSDYAAFADKLEHCYHDRIHIALGSSPDGNGRLMLTDRAVCAVTFWPLHAWIDDLRYRYEYECAGSFDVIDPAPIISSVVWEGNRNITGEVIIEAGGVLSITGSETVIQFAIAVVAGELNDQGRCSRFPGGNWWDDLGATGQHHIYKAANVPGFAYSAHADREPTAVSSGVNVIPCTYDYLQAPCEQLELNFGSPETTQNDRIAMLQFQINGSVGTEREGKEAEKRSALYEVLRKRMDEHGPLSAYKYLEQRELEGIGVNARDMAVSAMDAELWPAAQQHILALPTDDPDKDFLQWLLPVRQSGRSMAQLTEDEKKAFNQLRAARPSNNCTLNLPVLMDEVVFDIPFFPILGPLPERDKPKNLTPANKDDVKVSSAFRVYPNPANDHINIECPALPTDGLMHLHIYDGMGRRIKQAQAVAAPFSNISTGDLTPGLYVVELRCSGEVFRAKVMVSRR